MRVYLVGASGTGKSTLKDCISAEFGLKPLPSASREVAGEWFIPSEDWGDLMRDREKYARFQLAVALRQITLEADAGDNFVADRAFDHLALTAVYGSNLRSVLSVGAMRDYLDSFSPGAVTVFLCRPVREIREAALRQGGRDDFLNWEDMHRIDGAIQVIAAQWSIELIPVESRIHNDRMALVRRVLAGRVCYANRPLHNPDGASVGQTLSKVFARKEEGK